MKRSVTIELLEEHTKVTVYAFRFTEQSLSEFDQFIDNFESDPTFDKDLEIIATWLQKIGDEGIIERFFRPEGSPYLKAIPMQTGVSLRLYCFVISPRTLLLGGGGRKTTRTFQDDPVLNRHVTHTKKVGRKIVRRIESGWITVTSEGKLDGKLTMDIDV